MLISVAVVLLQVAIPQLQTTFYPDGDFATDLLLVNELDSQGYLLKGHYSRFGFNHPGPIFFYINALFEKLGALFDLSRANTWILSTLTLNLVFLLLIAWLLPRLFGQRLSLNALAAALPALVVLGPDAFNIWMPYRLVLPFAAFYLSLLLVLKEGARRLPLAVLLACLLIHGYVTMPLFTLPFLLLTTLLSHRHHSLLQRANLSWIGVSLSIGFVFFLPLLIDLLISEQSNLDRIISASQNMNGENSSWVEAASFTAAYWKSASMVLIPGTLLVIVIGHGRLEGQLSLIRNAVMLALLFTLVFALYYSTAPQPLYPFMGLYYLGVPMGLAGLLVYAGLYGLHRKWAADTLGLGAIVGVLAWLATGLSLAPLDKREHVQRLGDALLRHPGTALALGYPARNDELWVTVAGVLLYLKDHGMDACVARPELDFMYTSSAICTTRAVDAVLDYAVNCADDCLYTFDKFAVRRPALINGPL
ncbi:MAG: hypothetical protein V4812_09420 [Pseudomonadota bacterium]